MRTAYHPRRDSVPDRTIDLMRRNGRGLTAAEISLGTGYSPKNIGNILQACVTHGVLLKMRNGKGVYWCLPEHAAPEFAPHADGASTVDTTTILDDAARTADGDAPLEIAVWHDGDVVVKGGTEIEAHNGGMAISYNRAQAEQLARMLTRPLVAAANV